MLNSSLLPLSDGKTRLRRLRPGDATAYAAGTKDPAVRRYGHLPESDYTPESVREIIAREVDPGLTRGDLAVLAIAEAASDAFMGSLVLFGVDDRRAEVGFWVHPEHRGKGITAEALDLATRFASESGMCELTARTSPENIASQRVLESAGYIGAAPTVEIAPSGQRVDLLHYTRQLSNA